MNSEYVFQSRWRVDRSRESLWDAFESLLASDDPLPWWPAVHTMHYDGDDLVLRASSHFGYRLTFRLSQLRTFRPDRLTLQSVGDLQGTGEVTFVELGAQACAMDIDWRVTTGRRWMRWSAWVLRPVFVAGHHLVMRQGEKRLNEWLAVH